MIHFIYTISKSFRRGRGYDDCVLKLYRVTKGAPKIICTRKYTHESDFQAALNAAEDVKALPKKYFAERVYPCSGRLYSEHQLKELGVAEFHQLTL